MKHPSSKVFFVAILFSFFSLLVCPVAFAQTPAATGVAASSGGIAVVDLRRVLQESDDGKAAKTKLELKQASAQKELDKLKQKLENRSVVLGQLKGDALVKEEESIKQEARDLQAKYSSFQQELSQSEQSLRDGIVINAQDSIKYIAEQKKYSVVLYRAAVAAGGVDITEDVIKQMNAKK